MVRLLGREMGRRRLRRDNNRVQRQCLAGQRRTARDRAASCDGEVHSQELRSMDIEITIDDPKAYTKPWTGLQPLAFQADTELLEYICNENNKYFEIIPKLTTDR